MIRCSAEDKAAGVSKRPVHTPSLLDKLSADGVSEMELALIDNVSRKLVDHLSESLANCQECRIAVAFVSSSGLALLDRPLRQCLEHGGMVEFLVGLDLSTTEPGALWTLHTLSKSMPSLSLYCLSLASLKATYHPKLYVAGTDTVTTIVVGSSNLTEGGLKGNLELNILIQASPAEEIVSDTLAAYNRLKFHPRRVQPDDEYLALYDEMYRRRKRDEASFERSKTIAELKRRFAQKARSLLRPVPTRRDLFGWQLLVYQRLPDSPFTTGEMYAFEEEFSAYYPLNRNVRAKIRQILQQLRNMGLIVHLGRSTWVKRGLHGPADMSTRATNGEQ